MKTILDSVEKNLLQIIQPLRNMFVALKVGGYILLMVILWNNTQKAWIFNDNPMLLDTIIYATTIILLGICLFHQELKKMILTLEEKQVVTK